ncbi:hypothetical protein [Candidatus Endowatersipora endosymbiont of Watersipora subatra]|uniref:hypothetical protein n=1 Tax=Candidatus Endowatersipora endosymbiont of Watersipora subatra TaxID=3077946 RepID=UPI00312C8BD7
MVKSWVDFFVFVFSVFEDPFLKINISNLWIRSDFVIIIELRIQSAAVAEMVDAQR